MPWDLGDLCRSGWCIFRSSVKALATRSAPFHRQQSPSALWLNGANAPTRSPGSSIRRDDVCAALSRGFWRVGGQDLLGTILTGLGFGMGKGDGLQEHWLESNVSFIFFILGAC